MLWLLVVILVLLAVFGGAFVKSILWLLLIFALIIALVGLFSGRRV